MAPTKTKPRKAQFIPGGGPFKEKLKGEAAALQAEYEKRAARAVRAVIKEGGSDYAKLQAKLTRMGVQITPEALENKISRGTFSTAFLLQCMDALGVKSLSPED